MTQQTSDTYNISTSVPAQDAYRHGRLIDLLLNNVTSRETLIEERQVKVSGRGSVHDCKEFFRLVTDELEKRSHTQITCHFENTMSSVFSVTKVPFISHR